MAAITSHSCRHSSISVGSLDNSHNSDDAEGNRSDERQFDLNYYSDIPHNNPLPPRPKFSVGGLVSSNYHSNPNLADAKSISANEEEEKCNSTLISNQPNSFSMLTDTANLNPIQPKQFDRSHDQQQTDDKSNLACLIKSALEKVPSTSVEGHGRSSQTIVVMMNSNSTNMQSQKSGCDKSPKKISQKSRNPSNDKLLIANYPSLRKTYSTAMDQTMTSVNEEETSPVLADNDDSGGGFKSSFAQEVAQTVRNSSFTKPPSAKRGLYESASLSIKNNYFDHEGGIIVTHPSVESHNDGASVSPNTSNMFGRSSSRGDEGASLTSGYFEGSRSSMDMYADPPCLLTTRRDSRVSMSQMLDNHYGTGGDTRRLSNNADLLQPSDDAWMTSAQFVKLLELQEHAENQKDLQNESRCLSLGKSVIVHNCCPAEKIVY